MALEGVRVVETAGLDAALAGRWLADLGAEVTAIEPPGGSPARRLGDAIAEFYDRGKRPVAASPESSDDVERVRALVANADVWLDGVPAWSDVLAASAHPRLVRARLRSFGPGAASDDLVLQAASGMAHANRLGNERPRIGFGLQAAHLASLQLVIGALLALIERERSGLGQSVEVSAREAVTSAIAGALSPSPFRIVRCRDGHVVVGLAGDWTTLRGWLAESGLGLDLPEEAPASPGMVLAALERWAAERSAAEIFAGAQLRRLPFAPVAKPEELVRNPALLARGFFERALRRGPGAPIPLAPASRRRHRLTAAIGAEERRHAGGGALAGLRVLDLTHVVAGPLATRILADHGADVIKVERRTSAAGEDRRRGAFGRLNRGKRGVAIDLGDPRGRALLERMVAASDVVIDNFSPRVMEHWGLRPERLRALRADVVAVSLSGFGRSGPWRDFVSFAPTLHALCGYDALMPSDDGTPGGWGFAYADVGAGLAGAVATLAALLHRARTGGGSTVDLSQLECAVALMGPVLHALEEAAPPPGREPERDAAPAVICRAPGGGWLAISVRSDAAWATLVAEVGVPALRDPRFAAAAERSRCTSEIAAALEAGASTLTAREMAARLRARGIDAAAVASLDELEHDPALAEFWIARKAPDGAPVVLDGLAVRLDRTPGRVRALAPLHGEHTDAVMREVLGLADAEIRELRGSRVIV